MQSTAPDFKLVMDWVLKFFNMPFVVYGFHLTFFHIFVFTIAASIICWFIFDLFSS